MSAQPPTKASEPSAFETETPGIGAEIRSVTTVSHAMPPPVRVTVTSTSLRKQQHHQRLLQNHQQGFLLPSTGHLQELATRKRFREAPHMTAGSLANQQSSAGDEDDYEDEDTRCTKKRVGGCARGPTSRTVRRDTVIPEEKSVIFGTFYPDRYLLDVDCILIEGCGFVSRSKFEKLGGSLMAKWYRSIRVVETAEALGAWLERHGITVVTGKTRQSRKRRIPNGRGADNANANTPSPIMRNASCNDLLGGDVSIASPGCGDGGTSAAVWPLTSPSHPAESVPHIEAGLSVGEQDLWPALWSFGCGPVCPPSQPRESEVLAAAGDATLPQPHLAGSGGVEAVSMLSPTSGAWASGSTAADVVATASSAAGGATAAVACAALTTLAGFLNSSSDVSAMRSNHTGVETLPHGAVSPGAYSICGRAALGCLAATTIPQWQECPPPSTYTVQPPQLHTTPYSVDHKCTGPEEWLEWDGSGCTSPQLPQLQQPNQHLQQLPQLQQHNQHLQQLPQLQQHYLHLQQIPPLPQQQHVQQLPQLQQHYLQLQQIPQLPQLQQQNQQIAQPQQHPQQLPQLQQQNLHLQQIPQLPQLQQQNQQIPQPQQHPQQLPQLQQHNLHLQQIPQPQQQKQHVQQIPQKEQQLQQQLQQQYSAAGWQPSDHNALSGACSDPWSPPAPPAQLSPHPVSHFAGDPYVWNSPGVYQERYPRIFPIPVDAPPAGFSPYYDTTADPAPSFRWMPMACPPSTDPDPWAGRVDTAAGVPFSMVCGLVAASCPVSTAGPASCGTDVDVIWESFQRWSEEEAGDMPQGQ